MSTREKETKPKKGRGEESGNKKRDVGVGDGSEKSLTEGAVSLRAGVKKEEKWDKN